MKFMLHNVRLSFNDIWTARVQSSDPSDGEAKFASTVIIEPVNPDAKLLEKAIEAAAAEKWPGNWKTLLPRLYNEGRVCFSKTEKTSQKGEVYAGFEGMYSLKATSKTRPTVFGADRAPLTQADGKIYSGCYVNLSIDLFGHSHPKGGLRVLAGLRGLQFVKHGDAFTGGRPADADEFEELAVNDAEDLA